VTGLLVLGAVGCSSDGGGDGASAGGRSTTTAADGTPTEASSSRGQGGELSLLTYNVAGLPAEISKVHPDVNIPLISPLLNDYDVVITQEDFDWWKPGGLADGLDFNQYHERLRAQATHEYRSDVHPGPEAVDLAADRYDLLELGDGLGVLSRLPISGNTRVPWTKCNGGFDGGASDCLAMKGFSLTTLELADGVTVDLYDLHGEAGGGPEDQALQVEDFEQLADYIAEHSEGRPIILGGDTNLHTDPPGADAHEDSADGEDLEIWQRFLEATGLTDSCDATDCDGPGRIDKVAFRSGDGVELEATAHRFHGDTFVDANGEDLSDHEPLEVRFRWSAT
ncbi:MAG: endonuclease/exonuclease/phosphatase family protein, partial [Actinobacteria bacterium]|nr:endonuclease/exonuclease/phosphatase family protein [Actinomycetota bacterium]